MPKPDTEIEVVALRVRATSPAPLSIADLAAPTREAERGEAVVSEADCTVYLPSGWRADVGPLGTWILQREEPAA